jgi:uridine kinase
MNNPADLVTSKLINHCKNLQFIVICGFTKTGKITIAKKLAQELQRELIISDNYSLEVYGDKVLEAFMAAINKKLTANTPIIVEGILCFRMLRKSIQLKSLLPDLVIRTECNEQTIRHFYKKDGEIHKVEKALAFNKGLTKIWNDYQQLLEITPGVKKPQYLELNTSLSQYGL